MNINTGESFETVWPMELSEIIQICKLYNNLGSSIQEQIDDVLSGNADECNNNALRIIRDEFLNQLTGFDSIDTESIEDAISLIDNELGLSD